MAKHAHFASDPNKTTEADKVASPSGRRGAHFAQPAQDDDGPLPVISASSGVVSEAAKPRRHRKLWLIPVAALLIAAATGYTKVAERYEDTFMPNTTVNGVDASGMTADELAGILGQDVSRWTSRLSGDGLDIGLTASNVGLTDNSAEIASTALSQQDCWRWPLEYFDSHTVNIPLEVTFDENMLWSLVQPVIDASEEIAAQFVDGGIVYDDELDRYRLEDDATARHINRSALMAQVAPQIVGMSTDITVDETCLDSDERVENALATANSLVSATVDLRFGDEIGFTVDSDMIAGWLSFDDDLNVILDEQAILDFGPGELSDMFDTVGTTRTYTRPDGKEITVSGGSYGWSIKGAETSELILAGIRSGQPTIVDVPTYSSADHVNPGGQEWGRYIDVDRTEQYGRFYDEDGNVIWETSLVTGQPNLGHETPEGVWYVTSKETNTQLKGPEDENGDPEWISYVDFWMGVVGNSVGLHNAPWRSAFGGDIYTWNGSHGCINMSYEAAQELFGLVEIGVPVIVHY